MLFFKYKYQEIVFKNYIGKIAFVYINTLLQTLVEVVVYASPYQYLIHFNYEQCTNVVQPVVVVGRTGRGDNPISLYQSAHPLKTTVDSDAVPECIRLELLRDSVYHNYLRTQACHWYEVAAIGVWQL